MLCETSDFCFKSNKEGFMAADKFGLKFKTQDKELFTTFIWVKVLFHFARICFSTIMKIKWINESIKPEIGKLDPTVILLDSLMT